MALRALMLNKQIREKKKELEELRKNGFEEREAELVKAIEEANTDEERSAVEEAVETFEAEKKTNDEAISELERSIAALEEDLAKIEEEPAEPEKIEERKDEKIMNTREFFKMNAQERDAFFAREDVKTYLGEIRSALRHEKREITNVALTIPEVFLGLIRENVTEYSKLYKHVAVRRIAGDGRVLIMGTVPEAIWTDCCANLNELTIGFNDLEMACWKVGGYFAICNANAEDSDIDLASEVLNALGQAIGLALDKAILYGRNATTTQKMPQGIVSRLVQTEEPTGYPATARAWVDLHTTNIKTIANTYQGEALFQQLALASGAAKGRYSRGEKVWIMNETTYTALVAAAMAIDASGAIVSGVNGVMPVIGGVIEVLSFIPDNVVIGGYFDLYVLAERAGSRFASSEHVRFLQDQTVYKGVARYDGAPAIAEAFVAIGINGTTPNATMAFATDTAN